MAIKLAKSGNKVTAKSVVGGLIASHGLEMYQYHCHCTRHLGRIVNGDARTKTITQILDT